MENLKTKTVKESSIDYLPQEIFPEDLNAYNTAFGGKLMKEIDVIAGMTAQRHTNKVCVTLLIDSIKFLEPAYQGEILVFKSSVNRAWNTSLEVGIKVYAENYIAGTTRHIVSAYLTFVAIDEDKKPVSVPKLIPESEEEKRRYEQAEIRREFRKKFADINKSKK